MFIFVRYMYLFSSYPVLLIFATSYYEMMTSKENLQYHIQVFLGALWAEWSKALALGSLYFHNYAGQVQDLTRGLELLSGENRGWGVGGGALV